MENKLMEYLRVRKGSCSDEKFEGIIETVAYVMGVSVDTVYCLMEDEKE